MSRFLVAPRPLEAMMSRPTIADLVAHPSFNAAVDLSDLPFFDSKDLFHLALADAISDGVYRHGLVELELGDESAVVRTDPLVLAFKSGLAHTTVTMGPDGGHNSGQILFDREAGAVPRIFRPGRWLIHFKEIQEREDDEVHRVMKKRHAVPTGDPRYSAVDDSDIFKDKVLGFRQIRNVNLPVS